VHLIAIRLCNVVVTPRAFLGISILFIAIVGPLTATAQQPHSPLYWTIREDALFSSQWRLNAADGTTIEILPGRPLVAMLEAERRISTQYNIKPKFLITNKPGLNAFAVEANGQTLVVVYADMIPVIGDDVDVWAALFGHEFAHLYHHHSSAKQTRAVILAFIAAAVNAYEAQKGRDRSDLVKFGEQFVDNTFSREQETQADTTGVRFMADAGFDPQGAVRLQELLIAHVGSSGVLSFLNTHPSGEARIRNIKQIIATIPAQASPAPVEFSSQDFKQWLGLCGQETVKSGADRAHGSAYLQECLRKHDPEFAKRYGLCAVDMNVRHATGGVNELLSCGEQSPQLHGFSYDVWVQYCSAASLAQGKVGLMNAEPTQQCVWEGDFQMAFRGALCESETIAMRLPSDQRMEHLRSCAGDMSDETKRFTSDNWKLACDRMGDFRATAGTDKGQIVQDCLAQGPAAPVVAPAATSSISPQQLYEKVTATWNTQLPKSLSPAVTECDRLASREGLPGIKRVYSGFIEAPAAETACLNAIKAAADPSRFQANLAGVYLQQGRYAEAFVLAKEAAKKNAVDSNEVLAIMYSYGLGVPRAPEKIIPLLLSEVARGSVCAIDDLGDAVGSGRGVEKAPDIAFKLYQLAATNGSAMAAADVANAYLAGNGVSVDVRQALQILRDTGEDYPPALNPLNRALRATPGSDPEEIRGLLPRLFEQMNHYAALGSLTAKMRLGLLYTNGIGVGVDKEKGFALLTEAARLGYPQAALWVGYGYLNGTGTTPDQAKAIEFFRTAAAGGSAEAEIQLTKLINSAR
jgi:TPR repeat protein/Zn-dependent protease with chaperone function